MTVVDLSMLPAGDLELALSPLRSRRRWRELREPIHGPESYPISEGELGDPSGIRYAEIHLLGHLLEHPVSDRARAAIAAVPPDAWRRLTAASATILDLLKSVQEAASGLDSERLDSERSERLRLHALRLMRSRLEERGDASALDLLETLTDPVNDMFVGVGAAMQWACELRDRTRATVLRGKINHLSALATTLALADIQAAVRLLADEVAIYG